MKETLVVPAVYYPVQPLYTGSTVWFHLCDLLSAEVNDGRQSWASREKRYTAPEAGYEQAEYQEIFEGSKKHITYMCDASSLDRAAVWYL